MRAIAILLIAIGILMLVFRRISFTKEEKLVDIGPVEISKRENKQVEWPLYAGGIAIVVGIILVIADKKPK
ncbi:MAG: hypothetical protein QM791_04535 [Ferruginibacter sp.]